MNIISYKIDRCMGKWYCSYFHEDGTKTISDEFSTLQEALNAGSEAVA